MARGADMWLLKICLIFVGRGGIFEFLRGLNYIEIFLGNGVMAEN